MTTDAFWEFEREGWSQAAAAYEECWTDTGLFLEPLLDAAGVQAGSDLLDPRGPDSARFADPDEARTALGKAGFDLDSLRVETVLQAEPPERLEAIRAAIVEDVERYADGDEFTLPIVARVVSAATPSV